MVERNDEAEFWHMNRHPNNIFKNHCENLYTCENFLDAPFGESLQLA